jgi:hypothetical protein
MTAQTGLAALGRSSAPFQAQAAGRQAFLPQVQVGRSKPTPYRAPFRAPYNPTQLLGGRQALGQTFKSEELPRAISFGVMGGASLILASAMPGVGSSIATAAGLGLIGYGLYSVFSGPAAPPKTEVEVDRSPLPEGQTRENVRVTAGFTYPPRESTVSQSLLGKYRLAFSVTNRGDSPVDVFATVKVEEFTRITKETGVREKTYVLRGIRPSAQKGVVDSEFPSSFITGRHDAVATLYLQVANDHGGDVYAATSFALDAAVGV